MVEDICSLVINEDDFLILVFVGKDFRLALLGHEFGACDGGGFEFLTGAGVEKDEFLAGGEEFSELARGDEHFHVMSLTLGEANQGVVHVDFVFFANQGQGVGQFVGAGLASADMKGRKKSSPGTGIVFKEGAHR